MEWNKLLNFPPENEEILAEMKNVKNLSPGEGQVRMNFINWVDDTVRQVVVKTVKFMFNQRANRWSESLKVGLMIPLHKKRSKRRHKQLSRSDPVGCGKQNTGPNYSKQIESLDGRIGAAERKPEWLPSWALDG